MNKVMPLARAVEELVEPGMSLHFAYGGGRPNAAVAEIVRRFAGSDAGFTVSAQGFVNTQHALLAAGLVRRLVVAYAGENFPSPRPNAALQRAVRDKAITIENWSIWTLTARLMAGALGVDFLPVRSLAGSSMAEENQPFGFQSLRALGSEPTGVVLPLRPDLVLVHGLVADSSGNVVLAPPYGEGAWGALAARRGVLACVERVVDFDVIRAHNSLPMIPGHVVRAVCETPFGSHPYGLSAVAVPEVEGYGEDPEFMAELRSAAREEESFRAWVEKWMVGVADHAGFLAALGADRLARLRGPEPPAAPIARPRLTADERMTLTAVRVLRDKIARDGCDVLLAGIGYAHLAAWTAIEGLGRDAGVELAAELGMSGFRPGLGDPYLFARQNMPTCAQLTDVLSVLARDVSGPATRCVGVLGAGQVDRCGNINSTWAENGDYLLGSGGGNDVASAADDVVVVLRHSADRLVDTVGYITAPGRNVSTIVTSEAVLERRDGRYVVTRFLADVPPEQASARIAQKMGWSAPIASDFQAEPPATPEDVALLRAFDPRGVFLRASV